MLEPIHKEIIIRDKTLVKTVKCFTGYATISKYRVLKNKKALLTQLHKFNRRIKIGRLKKVKLEQLEIAKSYGTKIKFKTVHSYIVKNLACKLGIFRGSK